MLATAKNYDVICLQMKEYMPHLETPLKEELHKMVEEIKAELVSTEKIKPFVDSMRSQVFNFRVKAIKWLIEAGDADFSTMAEDLSPHLYALKQNPSLEILGENILFAIRCNKRVLNALIGSGELTDEKFTNEANQLPVINYEQFLASLAFSVPGGEAAQKIVDWVNASLYIELIILAADIINDEKLNVSDKIINELSFLIANAAQEYMASAIELGLIKSQKEPRSPSPEKADNFIIKEQKDLADSGLDDFAENF